MWQAHKSIRQCNVEGCGKLCGQTSGNAFDIIRHDESCNGWELCIVWQLISHSEGLQRASSQVNQRGEKPHVYVHVDTRRHRQCRAEKAVSENLPAHAVWIHHRVLSAYRAYMLAHRMHKTRFLIFYL